MAITVKKNQALEFTDVNAALSALDICGCSGNYCQPVQTNDIINIQGAAGLFNDTNLSVLASWNFGTGWVNDGGVIVGDGVPTDTTQAISNALGLGTNRIYDIFINATTERIQQYSGIVQFYAPSTISFDDGYFNLKAGDSVTVSGGSGNDGTYTVTSCVSDSGSTFIFVAETTITNELYGTTVVDMPNANNPQANKGYRFKFNGAYLELPIVTPDTTGDFTSQAYLLRYTIDTGGTITDDRIRVECSDSDIIVKINSITITLVSRVGIAVYKDGGLFYSAFAPYGIVTYYPVAMRYINNLSGAAELPFVSVLWNASIGFATFAGVVIGCSQISFYDSTSTGGTPDKLNVSNCINTQVYQACTLVFNAANNDNAFGFDYTTGGGSFQHFLRVYSKMDVTAYPEETESPYIFSNNNRVLMFARRDTEFSIYVGDAPNHIHACLSHMRLHDRFSIGVNIGSDLAEYVKDGNYELDRRKTSKLKQATFTVREKQGLASNFPCV